MFSTKPTHTITLALAVLCAITLAVGGAAAAEAPDNPLANETTAADDARQITHQLGDLVVHDYSYNGEVMTITATWTGDAPTTLTLTEMIEQDQGGATKISFKRVRLLPGEKTEITIALEERSTGTAAAMLTTRQSVRNANALVLQSGNVVDRGPIPFGMATILMGLFGVGGAGAAFVAVSKTYGDEDSEERRERIV